MKNRSGKLFWICLLLMVTGCTAEQPGQKEKSHLEPDEALADTIHAIDNFAAYKNGDIIFIRCNSRLSIPIAEATKCPYTHCGVFWNVEGLGPAVMEAYDTSGISPFNEFRSEMEDGTFIVMRLKGRDKFMNAEREKEFLSMSKKYFEKPYDIEFMWDDDKMYCSELVYKLYENIGVKLCYPRKIKDFDLSAPSVKQQLEESYHGHIPYNETVVAPVDILKSPFLDTAMISR